MDLPYVLRVLLLEDDPADAMLLERELERADFKLQIDRVEDREGFEKRLEDDIDLIISDHALPQFNALEALALVQQRGLDIPFIIVSGVISEETAVEAMRRGADDYLLKDRPARLGQAVRKALLEHRHRQEKERADEAIRQSEARYRLLAEHATDMITRHSPEGICLFASPASRKLLGYEPDELVGRPYAAFLHPEDRISLGVSNPVESGDFTITFRARRKDGRYVWVESSGTVMWDEAAQRASEIIMVSRDVTDRKRAEDALRESEERWRLLFETNPEAVLIIADDAIEYCNPALAHLLGAPSVDALQGQPIDRFIALDNLSAFLENLKALRQGESSTPKEYRIVRLDGQERYVEIFSVPITFQGRRVYQTVVRDLTERKEYERQLIEARDHAEEMSRIKTTFLTNMSHEIRTPLTGILGCAEVLAETTAGEAGEFARMIYKSGTRLMETLSSVLDLAQLEGNEIRLKKGPLDLARQVEETADLFKPQLHGSNLYLTTHFPADPVSVLADRGALNRILTNLISNALKFTKEGGITLTVEERDGRGVVHVTDTGVGISPEFFPKLFREFEQESSGLGRNFEGSGLGLAISQRLAKLLDGEITVESEKGRGSTFSLHLPLARVMPASEEAHGAALQEPLPEGRRILLAEDDAETRQIFTYLLGPPHDLTLAGSAEEAVELLRSDRFDTVILDINLGGQMTGKDVLRHLRSLPAYQRVPVIACTAYALPGDAGRFLEAGFDAYLPKPFTREQLLATLHTTTWRKQGHPA